MQGVGESRKRRLFRGLYPLKILLLSAVRRVTFGCVRSRMGAIPVLAAFGISMLTWTNPALAAPPVVQYPIEDFSIEVGEDAQVPLERFFAEVFADPDGDFLSYSVSQTGPDVAEVRLGGSIVTVFGRTAGATEVTVTASDGTASVSDTFVLTVEAAPVDLQPDFGDATVADRTYAYNEAIAPLTLPAATGGDGALAYSLAPALPAGLSFDGATRQLGGTPTAIAAATAYTYTVTDADGDSATLGFTIAVTGTPTSANLVLEVQGERTVLPVRETAGGPNGAFPFSPGAGSQAALKWVRVVSLPDKGTLKFIPFDDRSAYPATPVAAGATVAPEHLSNGPVRRSLAYFPPDDAAEAATTGFTFKVVDTDGLESAATYTVTLNYTRTGEAREREAPESEAAASEPAAIVKTALAEMARASLAGAADTIGARFAGRDGGATVSLAGEAAIGADAAEARSRVLDPAELLDGSAFSLPLSGDGDGGADVGRSVWGGGDWRRFQGGRGAAGTFDGAQRAAWLGADMRTGDGLLAGLAVSRSAAEADYRHAGRDGRLETTLVAVWPYVQMETRDGGALRAMLGAGRGEARLRPADGEAERADLALRAGSVGGRRPLARVGGLALSASGEASLAQLETDRAGGSLLGGVETEVWRLQGALEAAHDGLALAEGGWTLTPGGSLALRRDGGDGARGSALEVAGAVRLTAPGGRFGLDARGRWLALHSAKGAEARGASLTAWIEPGADGRGPQLSFGPSWGATGRRLQGDGGLFAGEGAAERAALAARVAWGFRLSGGLLTPFVEAHLSDGAEDSWRAAAGLELDLPGRLGVSLAAEHGRSGGGDPVSSIRLRAHLRF